MIKHIIIWDLSEETKALGAGVVSDTKQKIKTGLEGLDGKIDGLVDIHVNTEFLGSSNGDIMLDSTFIDEEALKDYQTNPLHLQVATFVRSVVSSRKCVDYITEE